MKITFDTISGLQTLISLVLVLIPALVGLYYYRKADRQRLTEVIEDLHKISTAKDEANELLQKRVDRLEDEQAEQREAQARLEGHNDWLLRRRMLDEQYTDLLCDELRRRPPHTVPPRPAGG